MDSLMTTTVVVASILISFGIVKKQQTAGQKATAKQFFTSFCLGIGTAAGLAITVFSILYYNRPTTDYIPLAGLGIMALGLYLIASHPCHK